MAARRGFALFLAVIIIAVVAVLATVAAVTLSGDNDQQRIETAADVLHRLVAAMDTTKTPGAACSTCTSFGGQVAQWPGKLSQLTHKISTPGNDLDCNGQIFTGAHILLWRGPYYLAPIPTTGTYRIAPGFVANNQITRLSTTNMAIQMDGVSLGDAKALELLVEKKSSGAGPLVTFSLTNPTSVQYHLISAATIC